MVEQSVSSSFELDYSDVVIRLATRADLLPMEWDGEFQHFRNVYANAYARMQKGTNLIWIAEILGTGLIGQVFVQLICDRPELADGWQRAYLYSFRIKPDFRNHGLGSLMVNVIEEFLLSRQYTRLTLNVARDNPDAIRLYKRLGFQIVAEEPGVWSYPDEKNIWHTLREPSWRMEKLLTKEPPTAE
ncbi:MAG: GNAT family N-acetyltransferase [Anaerolineaceae bacterium]|nr:GNAT family N-acetyltransferase [Anaerolineaceae bacterium]